MNSNQALPFSSIKPLKQIGINKQNPFCSIVSQGKLIYTCGANVVMQNTKTNEQKILFTNSYSGQIQIITHYVTIYNEHLLCIAIREYPSQMHMLFILSLNSILFDQEDKKEKFHKLYLKNIGEFQQVKQIQFFDEGSIFGVVSQFEDLTNLTIMRTQSGQVFYQQSFTSTKVSIKPICLNKLNCISVLKQNLKGQITICLVVLDQISRKLYYNLSLEKGEKIMQYYYESYQEENILIALTTEGYILINKINEYQINLINRVDAKRQQNKSERKARKQQFQFFQQKEQLMPSFIQAATNKIIISYQQSCTIGVLFYSHYNPAHTKLSFVEQALNNIHFAKQIKSLRMAKDNCSLAALIEINPQIIMIKRYAQQSPMVTQQVISSLKVDTKQFVSDQYLLLSEFLQDGNPLNGKRINDKFYIAVQIDLLSNMIEHSDQSSSTHKTFSLLAAHNMVLQVEYCSSNNTLFLLMKNRMLKYYDLTPKQMSSKFQGSLSYYNDFAIDGLLLWEKLLTSQPCSMTIHPFNYTILLIYQQLLKFHYYNIKSLFPAFITTNVKNCNIAKYSPLGDKIILATTQGTIIVVNSYTYQVMKTITLPTITPEKSLKRMISILSQKIHSKIITSLACLKNGDLLVFSGHNTFSLILNYEKTAHFGFIDGNTNSESKQMIYDSVNNLLILLQEDHILVLAKSTINTKNRCELISNIQISATSAYLLAEIGILFIGDQSGVLHMLRWPDYQEDLYVKTTNKFQQFRQPIVHISLSANLNYIYTVSKSGCFCISEIEVNCGDDKIPKEIKNILIKANDIPLEKGNRWLISRSEEQRKEREIIKLRGEQADKVSNESQAVAKEERNQHQLICQKKLQLQDAFLKEIKYYEQHLGIQRYLQQLTLLKDESKIIEKKKNREKYQLEQQKQQNLKKIFQERSILEKEYLRDQQINRQQIKNFIRQSQQTMQTLLISFNTQIQQGNEINKVHLQKQNLHQLMTKQTIVNIREDYEQEKTLMNIEHQLQVNEILQSNQAIISKNRNKKVEMHTFQDKINDLNIEKQKMQYDLFKIKKDQAKYKELKQKLVQQNDYHKKICDRLIKQSKQLQEKVIGHRRKQKQFYYKIQKLEQEVDSLIQQQRQLNNLYNKISDDFVEQTQINEVKTRQLQESNTQLIQLKQTKKTKNYQSYALKNHYSQIVKTIQRTLQINLEKAAQQICSKYRSPTFEKQKECVQINQYQALQSRHQKLAQDANKWKEVKENYMNGLYRSHQKLQKQNLKLTYRYNDLLRLSQQYKTQIIKMLEEIEKAKRTQHDRKSLPKVLQPSHELELKRQNFSFMHKKTANKPNKINIKKKLICMSLHQQSGKFVTQV